MSALHDIKIATRATYCVRRFGYSDVHVDHTVPGVYRCLECSRMKGRDVVAITAAAMLGHLRLHWDRVPTDVRTRLHFVAYGTRMPQGDEATA